MTNTELVKEFLSEEGFRYEVNEKNGNIDFKYEMKNYFYVNNDEDNEYFQLVMPNIFDVTEDNRDIALEAANKVNINTKVVKACVMEKGVWLFLETVLDHSPEMNTVIPRALRILQYAYNLFYKTIQ